MKRVLVTKLKELSPDHPERQNVVPHDMELRKIKQDVLGSTNFWSFGFCHVPPKGGFPLHAHPESWVSETGQDMPREELYYILRGDGKIMFREEGASETTEVNVFPETVIYFPAHTYHGLQNTGSDMLTVFYITAIVPE